MVSTKAFWGIEPESILLHRSGGIIDDFDYLATSPTGYVQQIACGWVRNGYYFYVQGVVPASKDPRLLDAKFLRQYPIRMKASRRHSRKRRGVLNVAYLRYGRHWIMLATAGRHEETKEGWLDWRVCESGNIRNCRRGQPIHAFGYSISSVRGGAVLRRDMRDPDGPPERDFHHRVRVQISRSAFGRLRRCFLSHALTRDEDWFAERFWHIPFEPYAPVRKQLLRLLMQVNKRRKRAGLSKLSPEIIRYHRKPVKVFLI